MAHKIIWSPEALDDLTSIRDFIARDSENYAIAVVDAILTAVEGLPEFPQLGQAVVALGDASIRQLVASRYRIIYRVRDQHIDVAAVIDGARDLPTELHRRGIGQN